MLTEIKTHGKIYEKDGEMDNLMIDELMDRRKKGYREILDYLAKKIADYWMDFIDEEDLGTSFKAIQIQIKGLKPHMQTVERQIEQEIENVR